MFGISQESVTEWKKIINIPELKSFLIELNTNGKVPEILNEMIIQSKVEFNYEDLSEND